jgi:hypothetical protein
MHLLLPAVVTSPYSLGMLTPNGFYPTTGSSAVRSIRRRWPSPHGGGVIDPDRVGPSTDRGRQLARSVSCLVSVRSTDLGGLSPVSSDRGRPAGGCLDAALGVGGESVGHLFRPAPAFLDCPSGGFGIVCALALSRRPRLAGRPPFGQRPDAINLAGASIFMDPRRRTGYLQKRDTLPALHPYLRLIRFHGRHLF